MATILLIDDDASNREPIGKLLRLEGYEVVRAANGRDALELLSACPVDLILLDLVMPEMDGLTFLKLLRRDELHKHLPVVMLTALSDGEPLHRSQRLGVNEYLVKSRFSPERLMEVVRGQLLAEPHVEAANMPETRVG